MKAKRELIVGAAVMVVLSLLVIAVNSYVTAKNTVYSGQTFVAGTYTASALGLEGDVTLETTFSDVAITGVTVTDHNETEGIGTLAIAALPGQIIETQSLDLDAVSGATYTSNAILNAVADCVNQAGGDSAALGREAVASSESSAAAGAEPAEPEEIVPAIYNPGIYTAFVDGYDGDEITVKVSFSASEITAVEITDHNEYDSIGTVAVAAIPVKVIEAQSADVDVISGATITSDAIIDAVANCIERALVE